MARRSSTTSQGVRHRLPVAKHLTETSIPEKPCADTPSLERILLLMQRCALRRKRMRLGPGCEKNKHQHSQENAEHNVKNDRVALIASEASFRADFVAEYQKFLNHRGIVVNFPLGALAHLGLARAYA